MRKYDVGFIFIFISFIRLEYFQFVNFLKVINSEDIDLILVYGENKKYYKYKLRYFRELRKLYDFQV